MMKKWVSLFVLFIFLFGLLCSMSIVAFASDEWVCQKCGSTSSGNFCSNCGEKRSDNGTRSNSKNGDYKLSLKIGFEENIIFSTYDVELYVNDDLISVIPHGKAFEQVLYIDKGEYTISFFEQGDHSVKGVTNIAVSKDTDLQCKIHARSDEIKIDNIRTNGGEVDTRLALGKKGEINGIGMTLTKVKESKGSRYNKPESGNIFVLCDFEVVNHSSEEITISSIMCFEAYCDGYKYDSSFAATIESKKQLDGSVSSGKKLKGSIGFEVPKDWNELEVIFKPELFSNDNLVFLTKNK